MPLKAGVVQFSPSYALVDENLQRLETLISQAVVQGAELLVLPEMAWTGYLWPNARTLLPWSETSPGGPGQTKMVELARRWGITLVYGFPERDGGRLYNSQRLVGPDGLPMPVYRKTHLFEADTWWASPGESGYQQWLTPWGAVGSGICMDLNFPDLVEWHATHGTLLLAFSTNWLDQEFDVIPYWEEKLQNGGQGLRGWALFANRGGEEFGVAFRGQSALFHNGRCVASLPGTADGVLVMELDF